MEISILLTILLIIISLGGTSLREGKICLINEDQIDASLSVNYNLKNVLSQCAVKLVPKAFYMLNNIAMDLIQKATQKTLIQPQNLNSEG
ncbi:hypothetical protein [Falsiporphyromonas endometrii]|uniref:Uncharacterized protein n=1 Tax=Falsiporphyromonas endometrii TaxID=1387297 RepID=A0ABV9K609_9PORP